MKAYIVTIGTAARMHTSKWIADAGIEYAYVTHTKAMADKVQAVDPDADIIVTGRKGLLSSRNYILEKLVPRGEWFIGLDDNVQYLTRVNSVFLHLIRLEQDEPPPDPWRNWREVYNTRLNIKRYAGAFEELRKHCVQRATPYGALACQPNPFWRKQRWSYMRYAKSKAFVMQNVRDLCWGGGDISHDCWMTMFCKANYGGVVVDNWTYPWQVNNEPGGIGAYDERKAQVDADNQVIAREWAGLCHYDAGHANTLRFDVHTEAALNKWRRAHGYLK